MAQSSLVFERFVLVAQERDPAIAKELLFSTPVLLWSAVWPDIEAWIAKAPKTERDFLTKRLTAIQRLAQGFFSHPESWPPDKGPVEEFMTRVEAQEVGLDYVLSPPVVRELVDRISPAYVRFCAHAAHRLGMRGDWRAAVPRFRLLLRAFDVWEVLPPGSVEDPRPEVARLWLEVALAACADIPDGRLFREASERGEAAVQEITEGGDRSAAGLLQHTLAAFYLGTYISGRTSVDFPTQLRRWRDRLIVEYGYAAASDESLAMPDADASFARAIDHFQAAADLWTGRQRGESLKGLAEALFWREVAEGPSDRPRLIATAREALSVLDPIEDAGAIEALHAILNQVGGVTKSDDESPAPPTGQRDLLWLVPEELISSWGETEVLTQFFRSADGLLDTDPATAVGLARHALPMSIRYRNGHMSNRLVKLIVTGVARLFGIEQALSDASGEVQVVAESLRRRGYASRWPPVKTAASLLGVAVELAQDDREDEAVPLVDEAIEVFQAQGSDLAIAAQVLRVTLLVGSAVNAYHAGDRTRATEAYVEALRGSLGIGLESQTIDLLMKAQDVALGSDNRKAHAVFMLGLAELGPALITAMGPGTASILNLSWKKLVAALIGRKMPREMLWIALQAAKGGAYAAMLEGGEFYNWREDSEAADLLARWSAAAETPAADSSFDEATLLTAYSAVPVSTGDGSKAAVVANLERAFDNRLATRQVAGGSPLGALMTIEETQSLLGPRSVLLSQYIGMNEHGEMVLISLLLTREDAYSAVGRAGLPSASLLMSEGAETIEMGWLAPMVAGLRQSLFEYPGPAAAVAIPEAREELSTTFDNFMGGGLKERLSELRKGGKDHLCIHAHGPLHYYPQHLLGSESSPLAGDWIVTYLPHPVLLRRRRATEMKNSGLRPMGAIGLSFDNGTPHGLRYLATAVDEASQAASALKGEAWLEKEATEANTLRVLSSCHRVHLSTHGRHRVAAPAFQAIYLYPDTASDGILHTYELVGLDLRHIDLMALSACETSLGRIDVSDVPRGLTATLFLAGVQTIIGCMWEPPAEVTATFFAYFYAALADGQGKLDAFKHSQTATRKAFPAYRDWGVFQYSGVW